MKKQIMFIITIILALSLAACTAKPALTTGSNSEAEVSSESISNLISEASAPSVEVTSEPSTEVNLSAATHEEASDYTWDAEDEAAITLNGLTASAESTGVQVDGSIVTILSAGTYRLSGTLSDGQVVVNTQSDEVVRLILDGVDITSIASAPLYIADAGKVIVILEGGSNNTLTDGNMYVFANTGEEEPNAALFSASDLTIYGNGNLLVNANFNDGIDGKDGLIIASGNIEVNAIDDGIRGKDYLIVRNGSLNITATGDGLKSDNENDEALGSVVVENGVLEITAGGDAITAQNSVLINNGKITLASGGGSGAWIDETLSAKGIKGETSVTINGGNITINSADDCIHSNGEIIINNGTFQLASADDGMHADTSLTINGGEVAVNESYEGIESAMITINGGSLLINASDDGINVASGMDGSGMIFGGRPGGGPAGAPGQDMFTAGGDYFLYINNGYVAVNADGDGLDANGGIVMSGGVVLVNGPTNNGNGALDYLSTFDISGGFLVAVGSAGMAQAASVVSSQNSVLINMDSAVQAGTVINIQDKSGSNILSFTPAKSYQSILFSSPELVSGSDYTINLGGNISGDSIDGLSTTGAYAGGSQYSVFSVSDVVTILGAVSGYGPGGMPGGGGRR